LKTGKVIFGLATAPRPMLMILNSVCQNSIGLQESFTLSPKQKIIRQENQPRRLPKMSPETYGLVFTKAAWCDTPAAVLRRSPTVYPKG
jgi:hypothetical protein